MDTLINFVLGLQYITVHNSTVQYSTVQYIRKLFDLSQDTKLSRASVSYYGMVQYYKNIPSENDRKPNFDTRSTMSIVVAKVWQALKFGENSAVRFARQT